MRRGRREGEPRSRNCSLELQAKTFICSHPLLLSFLPRRSQGDSVVKPHLLRSKELKVSLGPDGCTGVGGWGGGESLQACRTHSQVVQGLPGNTGATLLFMQALQSSKEPIQGCRHLQQTAQHTWPGDIQNYNLMTWTRMIWLQMWSGWPHIWSWSRGNELGFEKKIILKPVEVNVTCPWQRNTHYWSVLGHIVNDLPVC